MTASDHPDLNTPARGRWGAQCPCGAVVELAC